MEFFDKLRECLQACQSPDATQRKNGEAAVRQMRDEDPRKFLATLTKEIADESLDEGSRQMACLIYKNFISNKSKDAKYADMWINLEREFKDQMKMAILATLASPEVRVRRQISSILSSIASIEIPRGEWDELIPSLCSNAESTETNIKLASLTTLGYVCDEIKPSDINDAVKNAIIAALTKNITSEPENLESTRLAIKALPNSIPYASQSFNNPAERDFIMEKIFVACSLADEEVREHGLQSLKEIASCEYESIEFYFQKICAVTADAANCPSDKVGAQAFEFWTSLAEIEIEKKNEGQPMKNYINECKSDLLGLIFAGLLKINFEEDDDDDEWGHALSAACCLQALATLLTNDVLEPVVQYVASHIQAADWKEKYAALMALGSIVEGPEKQKFALVIVQALQNLLNMYQDQNGKVREAISWVMSRICEHHAEVLLQQTVIDQFLRNVLMGTKDKPRVSNLCCQALEKLAVSVEPLYPKQQSNALTPFYQEIVQFLVINGGRTDHEGTGVDLFQASYVALISIVQNSCVESEGITYQLLLEIFNRLQNTVTQSVNEAQIIQDSLCNLMQAILMKVGHKVEKPLADNMIQMIIELFRQAEKVTDNGLIAFNGMIVGCGDKVELTEIGKYIKHALESQENECIKLACGIISDLAEDARMADFLVDFVPCLHKILSDQTLQREIKIPALHALGELCLNQGQIFNQIYLDNTLTLLNLAARASIQTGSHIEDQETVEYMKELRETIIDQYTVILMSAEDNQCLDKFNNYLEMMFDFLEAASKIDQSPTSIGLIITLVGDLSKAFSSNAGVKQRAMMPYIEQSILMLQQQPDQDSKEKAEYTLQAIKSMA